MSCGLLAILFFKVRVAVWREALFKSALSLLFSCHMYEAFLTPVSPTSTNKTGPYSVFSDETTFSSRQELLARLPSLTSLNGSMVSLERDLHQ